QRKRRYSYCTDSKSRDLSKNQSLKILFFMGYTCDFFAIKKEELDISDFSPLREQKPVLNNQYLSKQPHHLLSTDYWKSYNKYRNHSNTVEIQYKRLTFRILDVFNELFDIEESIDTQSHHFVLRAWEMELFILSVLDYLAENDSDDLYNYEKQALTKYLSTVKEEKDKMYYVYGWD
ncbi:MAG: hypothetical protein AAGJ93_12245, partial [Bacteroidota bacterium]